MSKNKNYLVAINSVVNLALAIALTIFADYGAPLYVCVTIVIIGMIVNYGIGRSLNKLAPKNDRDATRYYADKTSHLWFLWPGMFALGAVAVYLDHFILHTDAKVNFMSIILTSLSVATTMCLPMLAMYALGLAHLPRAKRTALFKDRMNENLALALKLMSVDIVILLVLSVSVLSTLWLPHDGILATYPVFITVGECVTIAVMTLGYLTKGRLVGQFTIRLPKKLHISAARIYTQMSLVSMFVIGMVIVAVLYSIIYFGESLQWSRLADILTPLGFTFVLPLATYIIGFNKSNHNKTTN